MYVLTTSPYGSMYLPADLSCTRGLRQSSTCSGSFRRKTKDQFVCRQWYLSMRVHRFSDKCRYDILGVQVQFDFNIPL